MDFDPFHEKSSESQALAHIRRESLDLYNRLHSVQDDVAFVSYVHGLYPNLPLLPNLRCGAWYTDPTIASSTHAYFKSTDGHFGNWDFNLRRPNLHLLPLAMKHGGMVIVDSTRAGKRIPDALSKTIPTWCATVNRAIAKKFPDVAPGSWDINLYTPPQVVSAQEHSQIEARLNGWADALVSSSYELCLLPWPLRPIWITPATSKFPTIADLGKEFIPIICLSASKQVQDGMERRVGGYAYIQGSGDDHELWGMGLTSKLFWEHQEQLLQANRANLSVIVESIVSASNAVPPIPDWTILPSPIAKVLGRIVICMNANLPSPLPGSMPGTTENVAMAFLQITAGDRSLLPCREFPITQTTNYLQIELQGGKKGQLKFLQTVLPRSMAFISYHLDNGSVICICCDTGKDVSIGVALAALQKYFDDNGRLIAAKDRYGVLPRKQSIKTRLEWIISSYPQANPSRATLKRVNEFLLTPALFNRNRMTTVASPPLPTM